MSELTLCFNQQTSVPEIEICSTFYFSLHSPHYIHVDLKILSFLCHVEFICLVNMLS